MFRFGFTLFITLLAFSGVQAQITGLWKSTDHEDGTEKSIVRIFEKDGNYFGQVEKLLPAATITHCTGCEGEMKDKSIVGMIIMENIKKTKNGGEDGKILDPATGKYYSCDLELSGPDQLKVRGYVGLAMLGKTMYWKRVEK